MIRLLAALQEDAKLTNQQLGERIGLSASQCSRRRSALEAAGLIRGYHAELDAERLGLHLLVFIQVTLASHSGDNARRFRDSADRMAMAPLPEDLFIEAVEQLVRIDRAWIPGGEGSLYLRPFMIASEIFLGVKPSAEYIFSVIASPVGSYFKGGPAPVSIWVSENYTRAAIGGTGAVKCGGNYAASLRAQAEAIERGCDQVVFLDAVERRYIEELGGMNIFFAFDDGSISTPPLGTILPGITRDSIIALAKDSGTRVREEPYTIQQWRADAASGKLKEAFACGTAAVITPIGSFRQAGQAEAGHVDAAIRRAARSARPNSFPSPKTPD